MSLQVVAMTFCYPLRSRAIIRIEQFPAYRGTYRICDERQQRRTLKALGLSLPPDIETRISDWIV